MNGTVTTWKEPPAMTCGAPMPFPLRKDSRLWVSYICSEPSDSKNIFSAVLEFKGVEWAHFGSPNDESIDEHPLYSCGLEIYKFHEAKNSQELKKWPNLRHWIITFHDETLEVIGNEARVLATRVEGEDTDRIVLEHAETGAIKMQYEERK